MQLGTKVEDITIFPQPALLKDDEKYYVYHLQGASHTFYYSLGWLNHGFLTTEKFLTPLISTGYHRAFNVRGRDKYILCRLYNKEYAPNKLVLLSADTGEVVLKDFGYWFLVAYDILMFRKKEETEWHFFDMGKDMLLPEVEQ